MKPISSIYNKCLSWIYCQLKFRRTCTSLQLAKPLPIHSKTKVTLILFCEDCWIITLRMFKVPVRFSSKLPECQWRKMNQHRYIFDKDLSNIIYIPASSNVQIEILIFSKKLKDRMETLIRVWNIDKNTGNFLENILMFNIQKNFNYIFIEFSKIF